MTRFATLAAFVLLACACGTRAGDSPRPDLLVEPAALAKPETLKGFVVLDARPKAKYEAGHVPDARWVDHADWAKSFGDGQDAAAWSKRVGSLGLTADSRVVVYDDNQAKDAARVWWILRYWGVKDVRLLIGGWVGWEKDKHPTDKTEPAVTAAEFQAVGVQVEEPAEEEIEIDLLAQLSFAADGVQGHEQKGFEEPLGRHAGSAGPAVRGGERPGHAGEDALGPTFDVAEGMVGPDAVFDLEHMKQGQLRVSFATHDRLRCAMPGV